mmetsp:Transcript_1045/g.2993  ORF Transcript_1045/g.2993 Transcript_1045/m.2993 type:complete len:280 (+) Transcript_1045:68-907(+)|eukprot:CAMPEP_0184724552 /NCGR_PEP_ID=MMETSP0314-20130426/28238_1 /TAXON_ID=38298 /ORGANISM="Rhodella maculata, Strain CCMP 736" /LENGTH=279 /DNA_ID=CAMNT_0027189567 /DNA_START=81 /DNA_END=920 /DNA_ORIENTATION=-
MAFIAAAAPRPALLASSSAFLSRRAPAFSAPRPVAATRMAADKGDWGKSASEEELARVVPHIYVYDHCPFCVKVRMIVGYKAIEHELFILQNDDKRTPTKMIGKKVLPILAIGDHAQGESMDIIQKLDAEFNGPPILAPAGSAAGTAAKAWLNANGDTVRKLTRPRNSSSLMAEFSRRSAREAFRRNHPMKDGSSYEEAIAASPGFVAEVNAALGELDGIIHSAESVGEGGFGYDDIEVFPRLRALTLIKGIEFPARVKAYVENTAEKCDIPLLYAMAL